MYIYISYIHITDTHKLGRTSSLGIPIDGSSAYLYLYLSIHIYPSVYIYIMYI